MDSLSSKKLLVALLSSTVGLAICLWAYRQFSRYLYRTGDKRGSVLVSAWQWLRAFLFEPRNPSGGGRSGEGPIPPSNGDLRVSSLSQTIDLGPSSSMEVSESVTSLEKRRVSGNPRVVVLSTRHIVFSDGEGAEVEFLPDSVSALQAWVQKRRGLDIYLITQCDSDETETRIRELIKKEAIKGFDENKLLFCSTANGLRHMARQLEPDLFIDTYVDNLVAATAWSKNVVLLGSCFPQAYASLNALVTSL